LSQFFFLKKQASRLNNNNKKPMPTRIIRIKHLKNIISSSLFGSVVAVAFQSAFHLEIYQNNNFLSFKN
jgi:hypothetical protein